MPFLLSPPLVLASQFPLGLEPVIQIGARLLAAFKIDFVCAASDFPFRLLLFVIRRTCLGIYVFVSRCFW